MTVLERFHMLQTEAGLTNKGFEEKAGFSNGTVSNWNKGKSSPSIESVRKVAVAFDVSSDYLLGLDDRQSSILSEAEKLLVETFRDCSEADRFRIIQLCMNIKDEKGLSEIAG